ncbi:MAG: hypothetical protein AABX28_00985 [Nanoarchaeota archaeon]
MKDLIQKLTNVGRGVVLGTAALASGACLPNESVEIPVEEPTPIEELVEEQIPETIAFSGTLLAIDNGTTPSVYRFNLNAGQDNVVPERISNGLNHRGDYYPTCELDEIVFSRIKDRGMGLVKSQRVDDASQIKQSEQDLPRQYQASIYNTPSLSSDGAIAAGREDVTFGLLERNSFGEWTESQIPTPFSFVMGASFNPENPNEIIYIGNDHPSGSEIVKQVVRDNSQLPSLIQDGYLEVLVTDFNRDRELDNKPRFSPDGSRIVYENNDGQIKGVDSDGGNPILYGEGSRPFYSPDGKYIIFTPKDGVGNQHYVDAETGVEMILPGTEGFKGFTSCPD